MTDPILVTAGALTLLAAAGSSAKFLYNLVFEIHDAPSEIRSQNTKLRLLHQTVSDVKRVYDNLPQAVELESRLRTDIIEFIEEIDSI